MSTVLTYGTFDLFHVGHVRLLRRAKKLGAKLIVGLSTDEFNKKKGKLSVNSFEDRREILLSCSYVDDVFAEYMWDQKIFDVKRLSVSTFVMGDDWKGKFDYLNSFCNVVYLKRTPDISTSKIKTSVIDSSVSLQIY